MADAFDQQLVALSRHLEEPGQEQRLPPISRPHYPIRDTGLAAALLTLGIPERQPGFFTRDVGLNAAGDETRAVHITFWLGKQTEPSGLYKTETITAGWEQRAWWEREFPLHPLNAMRAALEAREFWVRAIHARGPLPAELRACADQPYVTDSLHAACVLKACGYAPLAFSGRAFYLEASRAGVRAEQVLQTAALAEGATPPQWMAKFLLNLNRLLQLAKEQHTIVQQTFDDRTLLLTADSTRANRDKFFGALDLV